MERLMKMADKGVSDSASIMGIIQSSSTRRHPLPITIKLFVLALPCLLLAGCVGSPMQNAIPNIPGLMAKNFWRGKPVSEAIAKFGEPHVVKEIGNGRQQYLWFDNWNHSWEKLASTYTTLGPGGLYQYDEYKTETRHYSCSILMDVDASKIVERFDYDDNIRGACKNFFSL